MKQVIYVPKYNKKKVVHIADTTRLFPVETDTTLCGIHVKWHAAVNVDGAALMIKQAAAVHNLSLCKRCMKTKIFSVVLLKQYK